MAFNATLIQMIPKSVSIAMTSLQYFRLYYLNTYSALSLGCLIAVWKLPKSRLWFLPHSCFSHRIADLRKWHQLLKSKFYYLHLISCITLPSTSSPFIMSPQHICIIYRYIKLNIYIYMNIYRGAHLCLLPVAPTKCQLIVLCHCHLQCAWHITKAQLFVEWMNAWLYSKGSDLKSH